MEFRTPILQEKPLEYKSHCESLKKDNFHFLNRLLLYMHETWFPMSESIKIKTYHQYSVLNTDITKILTIPVNTQFEYS